MSIPQSKKSISNVTLTLESLNNYFLSVFTAYMTPVTNVAMYKGLPQLGNIEITIVDIVSLLLNVHVKKSSGPENSPYTSLKGYAEHIDNYLLT